MVEISPYSLQYRMANASALRKTLFKNLRSASATLRISLATALKHHHIKSILRQISLPFEYSASALYGRRTRVEVIPVDSSEFSREWIGTWPEMLSTANLKHLLELENTSEEASREYSMAALRISGRILPPPFDTAKIRDLALWQKREDYIADQVRAACGRLHPERPLYIGGWKHLLCGERLKTLREMLIVTAENCLLLDRGMICSTGRDCP
jgi:hypothetical protein